MRRLWQRRLNMSGRAAGIMFAAGLTVSCGGGGGGGGGTPASSTGLPEPETGGSSATVSFTDVTMTSGLARMYAYVEPPPVIGLSGSARASASGLAAADYDGDGDVDLYVVGGDAEPNRLFQNQGDGSFIDVAPEVGLDLQHEGSGPVFGDIDGDGDLDLFVGAINGSSHYLMRQDGGVFVDMTASSGLLLEGPNTLSGSFSDYDLDGDLDLFLSHWGNRERLDTETVWRNHGDGTFESYSVESDVADRLLIPTDPSELGRRLPELTDYTFTPNLSDINGDGYPDLLMVGDHGTSQVFVNNSDGTFTRTTDRNVIVDQLGMGGSVADYDNDGDMDWFVTSIYRLAEDGDNFVGIGNRLYRNDGDGVFEDVTEFAGVADGGWGWGSCFADFDNDGRLDIFHVNGWNESGGRPENDFTDDQVRFFHGRPDGTFVEEATLAGLVDRGQGRGVACFDAERDGDIDIVLTNAGEHPLVYYRNDSVNDNRYLTLQLEAFGVGSRITVTADGRVQMREIRAGNNYVSHDPIEVHFGLGSTQVVTVNVKWPNGDETEMRNVSADQLIVVPKP